jgi:hypothetical protein
LLAAQSPLIGWGQILRRRWIALKQRIPPRWHYFAGFEIGLVTTSSLSSFRQSRFGIGRHPMPISWSLCAWRSFRFPETIRLNGAHGPSQFGPAAWRFPNLCDVLSCRERAFAVEMEPAPAGQDKFGSYWRLDRSVLARPIQPIEAAAIFEVGYTGAAPKILLDGDEVKSCVRTGPDGKSMITAVDARPGANNRIEVSALPETRVRMIGLYRLPSSIVSPVKRGS